MDLGRSKSMFILLGKFLDNEVVQQRLDVLEVGHVPGSAENGVVTDGMKTLDILESGEGAVRRWWAYEKRW